MRSGQRGDGWNASSLCPPPAQGAHTAPSERNRLLTPRQGFPMSPLCACNPNCSHRDPQAQCTARGCDAEARPKQQAQPDPSGRDEKALELHQAPPRAPGVCVPVGSPSLRISQGDSSGGFLARGPADIRSAGPFRGGRGADTCSQHHSLGPALHGVKASGVRGDWARSWRPGSCPALTVLPTLGLRSPPELWSPSPSSFVTVACVQGGSVAFARLDFSVGGLRLLPTALPSALPSP